MIGSSMEADSHGMRGDILWERNIAPSSREEEEDKLLTEDEAGSVSSLLAADSPSASQESIHQMQFLGDNLSSESKTSIQDLSKGVVQNRPPLSPPPAASPNPKALEPFVDSAPSRTYEPRIHEDSGSTVDDLRNLLEHEKQLRIDLEERYQDTLEEQVLADEKWQAREQRWWSEKTSLEARAREAEAAASVARKTAARADEQMRAARSALREKDAELALTVSALQDAQRSVEEMQRELDGKEAQLSGGLGDARHNYKLEELAEKHAVELERAQGRLSTARAEALNLRAQLQNTKYQLQEAKANGDKNEKRVGELEKHLASLKQRVSDSDSAVTQRHLRALDDLHQKMSQCEREVQALKERENELELTASAAAHETERWKSEWQRLQDEVLAVKDALRVKEEEESSVRRLARAEMEAKYASEISQWREKVRAIESKHDEEMRRAKEANRQETENRALLDVEQWAKLDGRVQSLSREKEHVAQQLRVAKDALRSKEAECDELARQRERDMVAAQAELDDTRAALERKLQLERQTLEDEVASLGETIRGLTQSCDEASDKLATEKEKVVVLTRELKRMDKEMENLADTVTDHTLLQDKQLLRDELRQLQADYTAQGKSLHETKRRLMAVEQDKQAVERDMESQVREKEVVKAERDRYAREVATYQTLTAQLRKDVAQANSLEAMVMDAKQQENQFRSELGHAEEEMRRLQADHKALVVAYERMRDERDEHARNLSRMVEHNTREQRITIESAERDVSALKRENAVLRATVEKLKDCEAREQQERREQEKERMDGQHRENVQWKQEREYLVRQHEMEIQKLKEELNSKLSAAATLQRSLVHSTERIGLLERERDSLVAQTESLEERHQLEILEHREETLKWKETCRAISTQQKKAIAHEALASSALAASRGASGVQSTPHTSHPFASTLSMLSPPLQGGSSQPHHYSSGIRSGVAMAADVNEPGAQVRRDAAHHPHRQRSVLDESRTTSDAYEGIAGRKVNNNSNNNLTDTSFMDPLTPPSYYREPGSIPQHNGSSLSSGMVYTPTPSKDAHLKRTVNAARDVLKRPT